MLNEANCADHLEKDYSFLLSESNWINQLKYREKYL